MVCRPRFYLSGLLAFVLSLSGCATAPGSSRVDASTQMPASVELTHIGFYPQTQDQCGPAALATVLESAGVVRTLTQLQAEVYVPQRQGSLQFEMLGGARRAGVLPYVLNGDLSDLWQEVAAGHPVVVLQNLRWEWLPLWHYAVLVGYDHARQTVVLRSGEEKRLVMSVADFETSWKRADRWAFVALSGDQRPATATAERFVEATLTLERVAPLKAQQAYQTALEAWPRDLTARLALGNIAYKAHDLKVAQMHYAQAVADHPRAADAWNNLAQVLYDTQQWTDAKVAVEKALDLGGIRVDQYKATQRLIDAAL